MSTTRSGTHSLTDANGHETMPVRRLDRVETVRDPAGLALARP
jgi:hypothetical protein